jgi:2-methylcitrate synthase
MEALRTLVSLASADDPDTNVDFYAATAYHYLGIPTDLFTGVFSVSRMAGWTAHVIEQHADNRLIRPDSEYIGARGLSWIPAGQR